MTRTLKYNGILTFLLAVSASPHVQAQSDDVDFSCMKVQVRPIIQVTDRHKEFDIVVRNRCPGDVYWKMCIERMDPWSHKVIEPLYPSGAVPAEKKARVNVQMKNTPDRSGEQARFQEFYVNVGYAINSPAQAPCIARSCEAKKTEIRKRIRANDDAWRKARNQAEARLANACPDNGWNTQETQQCREDAKQSAQEELAPFIEQDTALQAEMAAIDPVNCQLHGGERVPDK